MNPDLTGLLRCSGDRTISSLPTGIAGRRETFSWHADPRVREHDELRVEVEEDGSGAPMSVGVGEVVVVLRPGARHAFDVGVSPAERRRLPRRRAVVSRVPPRRCYGCRHDRGL